MSRITVLLISFLGIFSFEALAESPTDKSERVRLRTRAVDTRTDDMTGKHSALNVSIIDVRIDIRPWLPDIIYLGSRRIVHVEIYSDDHFGAAVEIDPSTVTFGRAGLEATAKWCWKWDLNRDSKEDLLCAFPVGNTGFQPGDTIGVLKGKTLAGELIQGTDSVRIVSR